MYQTKALHVRQGRADHVDRNQFLETVDHRLRVLRQVDRQASHRTGPVRSTDPRARKLDALADRLADLQRRQRLTAATLAHREAGDQMTRTIDALRAAVVR